jgi:hypothetical protein
MYVFFGLIALSFIWPQLAASSPALEAFDPLEWLLYTPTRTITWLLLGS